MRVINIKKKIVYILTGIRNIWLAIVLRHCSFFDTVNIKKVLCL